MFSGEEICMASTKLSQVEDSSFRWVLGPENWLLMNARQLGNAVFACNRGGVFEASEC